MRVDVALEDEVGVGRDLEVDRLARHRRHRALAQEAGEHPLVDAVGQRRRRRVGRAPDRRRARRRPRAGGGRAPSRGGSGARRSCASASASRSCGGRASACGSSRRCAAPVSGSRVMTCGSVMKGPPSRGQHVRMGKRVEIRRRRRVRTTSWHAPSRRRPRAARGRARGASERAGRARARSEGARVCTSSSMARACSSRSSTPSASDMRRREPKALMRSGKARAGDVLEEQRRAAGLHHAVGDGGDLEARVDPAPRTRSSSARCSSARTNAPMPSHAIAAPPRANFQNNLKGLHASRPGDHQRQYAHTSDIWSRARFSRGRPVSRLRSPGSPWSRGAAFSFGGLAMIHDCAFEGAPGNRSRCRTGTRTPVVAVVAFASLAWLTACGSSSPPAKAESGASTGASAGFQHRGQRRHRDSLGDERRQHRLRRDVRRIRGHVKRHDFDAGRDDAKPRGEHRRFEHRSRPPRTKRRGRRAVQPRSHLWRRSRLFRHDDLRPGGRQRRALPPSWKHVQRGTFVPQFDVHGIGRRR